MEFVAKGKRDFSDVLADPAVASMMADLHTSFRLMTMEGEYLVVSGDTENVVGYSPGELFQVNAQDLVHPEDRPMFAEALATIRERPVEIVTRKMHKDGRIMWARGRGMRIDDVLAFSVTHAEEPLEEPGWTHIEPLI